MIPRFFTWLWRVLWTSPPKERPAFERDRAIHEEAATTARDRESEKHADADAVNRRVVGHWRAEWYRRELEQAHVEACAEDESRAGAEERERTGRRIRPIRTA